MFWHLAWYPRSHWHQTIISLDQKDYTTVCMCTTVTSSQTQNPITFLNWNTCASLQCVTSLTFWVSSWHFCLMSLSIPSSLERCWSISSRRTWASCFWDSRSCKLLLSLSKLFCKPWGSRKTRTEAHVFAESIAIRHDLFWVIKPSVPLKIMQFVLDLKYFWQLFKL